MMDELTVLFAMWLKGRLPFRGDDDLGFLELGA